VAAGNEMRVSDAERDTAATELREHFASGRLDQEELDQRLTDVFAAKTRGDLNASFTDLPPGHGGSAGSASGGQPLGAGPAGTRGWFGSNGPLGNNGPLGPHGPLGPSGRFGPDGPFGPSGPFGAGGRWSGSTDDGDSWGARGAWRGGGGRGAGRVLGRVIVSSVLLWVLLIVGILGVFGIGAGRPLGVVLIFAAFAVLRRLLFSIFGRRRAGRGGGRGRGGRGRRWS